MTLPTRFTRRRFVARYGALTSLAALFVSGCGPPLTAPPLDLAALTPAERAAATHQEPSQTSSPTVSATPVTSTDPPTPSAAESLATPRAPTPPRAAVMTQGRLNYLRTDKARILDAGGNEVLLTGLNWFGMETGTLAPHGLWARSYQSMLDQIVRAGYNCLSLRKRPRSRYNSRGCSDRLSARPRTQSIHPPRLPPSVSRIGHVTLGPGQLDEHPGA